MIRTYDLMEELGLKHVLQINGCLQVISTKKGAPILFLFDEHHDTFDCKTENADNAKELVTKARVQIIGVEGYAGGYKYDTDIECYTARYIPGTNSTRISESPEFAHMVKELGVKVVGVDSEGHCDRILFDMVEGKWRNDNSKNHPFQKERSIHFIKTLFQERDNLRCFGSIILNAGKNHVDHIVEMIRNNNFDILNFSELSCVRVRPYSHPEPLC